MMRKIIILLLITSCIQSLKAQDEKYFTKKWFSLHEGFRNVLSDKISTENRLDFLNNLYTQEEVSDFSYFEAAIKLRRNDTYQIEGRLMLYNNLIPYCFNLSYTRWLNSSFGLIIGSMANRYYLTEFNGFYPSIFEKNITTRYISRQWNISYLGFYLGPTYQLKYKTIELNMLLKTGFGTFYPFQQRDIIKENQSNLKYVYDYKTRSNYTMFYMPKAELLIDLFNYKKAIIGGRINLEYLFTRTAINYDLTIYEWTYSSSVGELVRLPKHNFKQFDWDFGIFIRW